MEKAAAGLPKQGEHAEEQSMLLAQMGKVPSFSSCSTVLQNPKNSVYFGEDKKNTQIDFSLWGMIVQLSKYSYTWNIILLYLFF